VNRLGSVRFLFFSSGFLKATPTLPPRLTARLTIDEIQRSIMGSRPHYSLFFSSLAPGLARLLLPDESNMIGRGAAKQIVRARKWHFA
jgi:hypothetical protein